MSKINKHFATIINSGIVNNNNEQYLHIRSDGRLPKPNEFKIVDNILYISKTINNEITWVKYNG